MSQANISTLDPVVAQVTANIIERSRHSRKRYLASIHAAMQATPRRQHLSCGNLAHGFAASESGDKSALRAGQATNLAIITAYNDMLSAHQPYANYPAQIKVAARSVGVVAQVAGGVPAMCDGVTQGRAGMELSLFSRDVIALSTAVALSHDMFDAAMYLGICDKIVPGMLIAALNFGYLPAVFVPAGPMPTGVSNDEKSKVRQAFEEGQASREQLLDVEAGAYHSAGTCTFFGTANSNQMLMEMMGLHLPGASFVAPNSPLRHALTAAITKTAAQISKQGERFTPICDIIDERAIVNGMVGLHATGGSTNHLIHLVAIAAAAGIKITLQDFADLSDAVPLLARIYPNGSADVNQFHAAGGMAFVIEQLLQANLIHADVRTVFGQGLAAYTRMPELDKSGELVWQALDPSKYDPSVLRKVDQAFSASGGIKVLAGNLGASVIKVSSVPESCWVVEAPAMVFSDQNHVRTAFEAGLLNRNCVVVVRGQGPKANGMPELHKLSPLLSVLQKRGYQIALITDGRMSGASGQVPAAIHLTPESADGGAIGKIRDGDMIRLDALAGKLELLISGEEFAQRNCEFTASIDTELGMGRTMFAHYRNIVSSAELGASIFSNLNTEE